MLSKKWTLKESLDFVKGKRPIISPNPSFLSQLIRYEISLFGRSTISADGEFDFWERKLTQISNKVFALNRATSNSDAFSKDKKERLKELCQQYLKELKSLQEMYGDFGAIERELTQVMERISK